MQFLINVDELRSKKRDVPNVGCVVSIVWLRKTFKTCLSSRVEEPKSKVNKRFVSEQQSRLCIWVRLYLYYGYITHPTNHQLYDHPPPISKTIQIKQTRHAGHCWKCKDKLISNVVLWTLSHRRASVGRPVKTYLQQLCSDTRCSPEDLPKVMDDRGKWREKESGKSMCDMMMVI